MTSSRFPAEILLFTGLLLLSACTPTPTTTPSPTLTSLPTASPTPTLTPTEASTQTPWIITLPPESTPILPANSHNLFFFSLPDGGYYHLFAYSPQDLPITRLTTDPWDAITPALGPDGNWLAYASRRSGYWDLYLLNLQDGGNLRFTDSLPCDLSPSWSPDGAWLVYETCGAKSLEIAIRSVADPSAAPILLTDDTFLDTSPAWSPQGRQLAFISNRSGEPEVWAADLDHATSEAFVNLSLSPQTVESHPAWSPDGTRLAWASADPSTGLTTLMVWDARTPASPAVRLASGDWPVWQDNAHLATRLSTPNQSQLAGYDLLTSLLSLPPVLLPGTFQGIAHGVSTALFPGIFAAGAQLTPDPLYIPILNPGGSTLPGRTALVTIPGLQATDPRLSDAVDEAFNALRQRVAYEAGWDALASLEDAFVPLNAPLDPGLARDWLYTGRAITLNPALLQSGWMVVVRQDYGLQTWWRIYLRTYAQDGSQGLPLTQVPWDFSARTGSSQAYENGGALMTSIPSGYWLDLTDLAAQYGWERQPALINWRTYFAGARSNLLAFTGGVDWYTAMLELYPAEALLTPTQVIPPTRTPTRTPLYYRSPTVTRTPTPRPTSTP